MYLTLIASGGGSTAAFETMSKLAAVLTVADGKNNF